MTILSSSVRKLLQLPEISQALEYVLSHQNIRETTVTLPDNRVITIKRF